MHISFRSPLLLVILLWLGNACKKEDPLPPITGQGQRVFACYVNGKVWQPYSKDFKAHMLSANYYNETFSIGAFRRTEESFEEIFIELKNVPLAPGTYILGDSSRYARYKKRLPSSNGTAFITDSTHTGMVTIRHIDRGRHIITGTFSFTARQENGTETVTVTDGRFDTTFD